MFGVLCVAAGVLTGCLDYGADSREAPVAYYVIPLVAYFQIITPLFALACLGVF